jgi:hypothetical protein
MIYKPGSKVLVLGNINSFPFTDELEELVGEELEVYHCDDEEVSVFMPNTKNHTFYRSHANREWLESIQ